MTLPIYATLEHYVSLYQCSHLSNVLLGCTSACITCDWNGFHAISNGISIVFTQVKNQQGSKKCCFDNAALDMFKLGKGGQG